MTTPTDTRLSTLEYAILSQAERVGSVATGNVITSTARKLITFPMILGLVERGYLQGYYTNAYHPDIWQNRYRLTDSGRAAVKAYRAASNQYMLTKKRGE
jgi:hypothetical protein